MCRLRVHGFLVAMSLLLGFFGLYPGSRGLTAGSRVAIHTAWITQHAQKIYVLICILMLCLFQDNSLAKTPYPHTYLISADEISAFILPQAITAVHYPGIQALSNKLSSHSGDDPLSLAYTQDQKGLLIYPRGKEGKWQLLLDLADHQLISLHVVAGHGLEGQVFKIDADTSQKRLMYRAAVKVGATCKK